MYVVYSFMYILTFNVTIFVLFSLKEVEAFNMMLGRLLNAGFVSQARELAALFEHDSPDLTIVLVRVRDWEGLLYILCIHIPTPFHVYLHVHVHVHGAHIHMHTHTCT